MAKTLKVGIIGANAERGWARESHVPAIQNIAGLELFAVANKGQEAADAAAKAFGVGKAYGNATAMFRDPDIDLVTVATTLPAHHVLVLGALAAGKHIYCEYPLGLDSTESQQLAEAAQRKGIHTAIGLQMRASPAALGCPHRRVTKRPRCHHTRSSAPRPLQTSCALAHQGAAKAQ